MFSYMLIAILPAAWLVAAINDVLEMKIPNWISIALLSFFPVAALYFGYSFNMFFLCIALGLAVLIVGFVLFSLNKLGGGDVKLLAATAPWIGPAAFAPFMFKVILMGGAFAFVILMFRKTPMLPAYVHAPWVVKLHQSSSQMPYGLAIAAGGLWVLPDTYLFTLMYG